MKPLDLRYTVSLKPASFDIVANYSSHPLWRLHGANKDRAHLQATVLLHQF